MEKELIITIDGPAGAGKSTVASNLAQKLAVAYLDTGAMYRALTLAALEKDIPLEDARALTEMSRRCRISFSCTGGVTRIFLDGKDITGRIRTPEISNASHHIANVAAIRSFLVQQQRRIARELGSLVTEGRDQGSVAFPQAAFKFYLDASCQCRARRRYEQLRQEGRQVEFSQILADQQKRDARDLCRTVGPLVAAPGAVQIDTTNMNIEQVVETLYNYVTRKEPA